MPIREPAVAVPKLVDMLGSDDAASRATAAWELAGLKKPDPVVLAKLRGLQSDPDREVRYAVAWALGHLAITDRAFEVSRGAETRPRPIRVTRPNYPQRAFDGKVQGTVLLEILIGESGEIARAEVRDSIPALDAAALECVRQWQFEPMRVNGVARASLAQAPISFKVY